MMPAHNHWLEADTNGLRTLEDKFRRSAASFLAAIAVAVASTTPGAAAEGVSVSLCVRTGADVDAAALVAGVVAAIPLAKQHLIGQNRLMPKEMTTNQGSDDKEEKSQTSAKRLADIEI